MANLFAVLFLTSLICLVVGLIAPNSFTFLFRKKPTRKMIGLTYGIAAIAFFILVGFFVPNSKISGAATENAPTPTDTPIPTPTPTDEPTATLAPTLSAQQIIAKFESEGQHVTVADIYKTPNSYKGKSLIFSCSVSGFPKDENGDVGGLNCNDPNNFSSNVQVSIDKNTDVTKINQNDVIKVYGMGLGADTGKNAFGGDVTTGAILGLYINDLTTGYKNY